MEGTPSYLAVALASLDVAVESDSFVTIDSSNPLVVIESSDPILGPGVTIFGSKSQANVPLIISFHDGTSAGLDVTLTLTLYHNGAPTGDTTTVNLHILDNDDPDRPTGIIVDRDSVAEDAAAGTVVATLSTIDPNNPDSFSYFLIDTSNFVIVGNEIRVADNSHIDFEMQPTQTLQVVTTDASGHSFVKDIPIAITDANEAPTAITFANPVTSIAEDASTELRTKVADIEVTDDALGSDTLSLFGDDADWFEIDGTELFLKPGVTLDFETKSSYSVKVNVNDASVGTSPDLTSDTFTVQVADVSPETLNGSINDDLLVGDDGIEMIFGFAGNDVLNGIGGNDTLTGGLGKDWLTGGAGPDTFNFDLISETPKGTNRDVIMDFHRAELDHIDLSDIDAKSKTKTFNDHFTFIGAKAFHHKAGELHFIKKPGYLLVEGDIDGNGKADFQIEVHGITKLGALDFNL
jgi:Ca2+-binding RTX toxin-like protein